MKLPATLTADVERVVGERVAASHGVTGGCISQTAHVEFADGAHAFLKFESSRRNLARMFEEEARSLVAIAATKTVRVPGVRAHRSGDEWDWLLLEWLEPGPRTARNQRMLGEQLAALHRNSAPQPGWPNDNFIGSLPQSNRSHASWPDFWRAERLEPQLTRAAGAFDASARRLFDRLLDDLPALLASMAHEPISMLHGDLWSGNVHALQDGGVAVIDPSAYYGHRDVDIAMSMLFGGFSREFYDAYAAGWPHAEGFTERIAVYQLYYVLVHVNLFGGGYAQQAVQLAKDLRF